MLICSLSFVLHSLPHSANRTVAKNTYKPNAVYKLVYMYRYIKIQRERENCKFI